MDEAGGVIGDPSAQVSLLTKRLAAGEALYDKQQLIFHSKRTRWREMYTRMRQDIFRSGP
jgi:hypothetical protein